MTISGMALRRRLVTPTTIHVMALDGLINVNSLFTIALFLGLTTTTTSVTDTLTSGHRGCQGGSLTILLEGLVSSHVYSFGSFLFSSLVALSLKQAIIISRGGENMRFSVSLVEVNLAVLRLGIAVSSLGSVSGCIFLTMALVDLVQIKLGALACGTSYWTLVAIGPLVALVPSALIIYLSLVLYAFVR